MTCPCWQTASRCDECRASLLAQLRGVAARRAHTWVAELRQARVAFVPGADLRSVARLRLRDLTSDERLLEMLVEVCVEAVEQEMGGIYRTSTESSC